MVKHKQQINQYNETQETWSNIMFPKEIPQKGGYSTPIKLLKPSIKGHSEVAQHFQQ